MAELRKISDAELRAHSTPSDAWVAIAGDVYDVTRFLALHPGGETVLLPVLGRDATDEFNNFHSPSVLHKSRPKLRIGRLEDYEPFADKLTIDENAFGQLVPFGDPSWYQRFNSPYYTESHVAWRARMRAFVDEHIVAKLHEMHEAGLNAPPPELLLEAGRQGLLAAVCGSELWRLLGTPLTSFDNGDGHDDLRLRVPQLLLSLPLALGLRTSRVAGTLAVLAVAEALLMWQWWRPAVIADGQRLLRVSEHFTVNLAVSGSLMLLSALGSGRFTVDQLLKKSE